MYQNTNYFVTNYKVGNQLPNLQAEIKSQYQIKFTLNHTDKFNRNAIAEYKGDNHKWVYVYLAVFEYKNWNKL